MKGDNMGVLIQIVNGFCFGIGLILASLFMKFFFHVGFCN